MDLTKKRKEPDSAFSEDPKSGDEAVPDGAFSEDPTSGDEAVPDGASNEDPSSGDDAVPNWSAVFPEDLRVENRKKIADAINQNPHADEIAVLTAYTTAKNREEELFEEATGEIEYLRSVSDFIQNIPRTPGILQAEPVDLASEIEHLDMNSQLNSCGVTVDAEDLPEQVLKDASNDYIETVHPSVWERRQQFQIELIRPPHQQQQQQPPAGFRSDTSINLPPQQQPQQQQSGPNEHQIFRWK